MLLALEYLEDVVLHALAMHVACVDVSLFVILARLPLRPHNVLSSDRNHFKTKGCVASGPKHTLLRCGDKRKLSLISLASIVNHFIATAFLLRFTAGSIHSLPTLVAERAIPSEP